MALFTRFLRPKEATFHSSGIVQTGAVSASTIGSASTETFTQRQAVDSNRQHINQYAQAGLTGTYKQEAHEIRSAQQPSSSSIMTGTGLARRNSRIDIVKPSPRQVQSVARVGIQSDGRPHPQVAQRPVYAEPRSRGFDPYR